MVRAANLVLGVSVADGGKRMGECLQAAGYDIDPKTVQQSVRRGADITITGVTSKTYDVTIEGPDDIHLVVSGDFVLTESDKDGAELEAKHCALR